MVHAQMSLDEGDLNRQIARAIAHLFTYHPKAVDLHPDVLWDPPLDRAHADCAGNRQTSGATLRHLAGTGVFEGTVTEEDGYVLVKSARLTTAGYLLGQVSLAALETDDPKLAALVARRVHGKH